MWLSAPGRLAMLTWLPLHGTNGHGDVATRTGTISDADVMTDVDATIHGIQKGAGTAHVAVRAGTIGNVENILEWVKIRYCV